MNNNSYIWRSKNFNKRQLWLYFFSIAIFLTGCIRSTKLDVYQKNIPIPGYSWDYNFHPEFDCKITDTAAVYNIYVTIRHTNSYPFSNIWLLISSSFEGEKPKTKRVELPLADKEGQWLGSGMSDIYEHRIPIQENARFSKQGIYHFSFEQNMRLNPLPDIMSAGLRIEKVAP